MKNYRKAVLIFGAVSVFVTGALGCADAKTIVHERNSSTETVSVTEQPQHKVIQLVPLTDEEAQEPERINFDLQNLSITGRETDEDEEETEGNEQVIITDGNDGSDISECGQEQGEGDRGEADGNIGEPADDSDAYAGAEGSDGEYEALPDGDSGEDYSADDTVYPDATEGVVGDSTDVDCNEPDWEDNGDNGNDSGMDGDGQPDTGSDYGEYLGNYCITFYCPCEICCGQWATGCTASGVIATEWHTVAADLPFGTVVDIEGLGRFVVEDRGVYGEAIDVFVSSHDEALALGLQYRDVYVVSWGE